MKEATGELNMTVVTVVAIAAVGAFFYAFIWPSIKGNLAAQTHCASAVNCQPTEDGSKMSCQYYEDDGVTLHTDPIICDNSRSNVGGNNGGSTGGGDNTPAK